VSPAAPARLVALLGVTAPQLWTWRGATVILYATGPRRRHQRGAAPHARRRWAVPRAALYQLAAAHLGQQALPPPAPPAPGPAAGEAMAAFCAAWESAGPDAPSRCAGWGAHEVAAHVTATVAGQADLIAEHLAGQPARATWSPEEREPAYRALPGAALRTRLRAEIARFEQAAAALGDHDTITRTGWAMNARQLRTHAASEAALHRWDLAGSDPVSVQLLSRTDLTRHALAVFTAIPHLPEARRWTHLSSATRPVRLRSPGQPDIVITPGTGLSPHPAAATGPVITLAAHERLLLLWGRHPHRLRDPRNPHETPGDLLERLAASEYGSSAQNEDPPGR
jgi:uncharacterized protein (TIGR03083 family)